jgi:hypothetical protein
MSTEEDNNLINTCNVVGDVLATSMCPEGEALNFRK